MEPQILRDLFSNAPKQSQIALAALTAERFLPTFCAFAIRHGIADTDAYRSSLDEVWQHLCGHELPTPRALAYLDRIMAPLPDFEDRCEDNTDGMKSSSVCSCKLRLRGGASNPQGS